MKSITTDQLLKDNTQELLKDIQVVIMCGLPGSGKSYVAKQLATKYGAEYVSSDQFRLQKFQTSQLDPIGNEVIKNQSKNVLSLLYDQAIKSSNEGKQVIVDATHLRKARSEQLQRLVENHINALIIVVKTDDLVVRARAQASGKINSSDETWEEAVFRVRGYFLEEYDRGEWQWPSLELDGINVIEVWNN